MPVNERTSVSNSPFYAAKTCYLAAIIKSVGCLRSMGNRIFIKYRRCETIKDAQLLHAHLSGHFSRKRVFIDLKGIEGGADWEGKLHHEVALSNLMLILIGKTWLDVRDASGSRRLEHKDDFVRIEITEALRRDIQVIPIVIDGAMMPTGDKLPADMLLMTRYQAMPLRTESFEDDVNRIAAAIKQILARRRRQRSSRLVNFAIGGAAFAAGVFIGPYLLTKSGIRLPFVPLTDDAALHTALMDSEQRVSNAEAAELSRQSTSGKLAETTYKLDAARKANVDMLKKLDQQRRLATSF